MENWITSRDVVGSDPFGRFLFGLKLKPWLGAALTLLLSILYLFVLPAIFGVLLPREGLERSSIVDRVNQVGFLLVNPVVAFFYLWQPGAIAGVYRRVAPLIPAGIQNDLLNESRLSLGRRWIWGLGTLFSLVVVYLGVVFVSDYIGMRWYSYNWLMAVFLQISRFFLLYLIVVVLARHLNMAFDLNRIYRHIKLPVLIGNSHYTASFEVITHYGLWFAAFGGVLGLFIAVRLFVFAPVFPEDAIYLSLYLVLVPLAFFLPFWQAHTNMRQSRQDALVNISNLLQAEYDRFTANISAGSQQDMDPARIATLKNMLELTEKAPTWPYETWDLYRLLAATLSPFVMTGVGVLLDSLI